MRHKTPRVVHINENGRRRIDRGIDTGNRFNFPRLAVARDPAPAFSRGESFPPGTEGVGPINRDDRGDSAKIPKDQTPGSERDRSLRLSIRSNSSNFSPPPPRFAFPVTRQVKSKVAPRCTLSLLALLFLIIIGARLCANPMWADGRDFARSK